MTLKTILIALISLFLVSNNSDQSLVRLQQRPEAQSGTLEKMIAANGSVAMEVNLNRLTGGRSQSQRSRLNFAVEPDSFFTILVFNGDLRGPELGSMALIPQNSAVLPAALNASFNQLVIERTDWSDPFELVVRDGKTGFTFFNIEGNLYDYDAKTQLLSIKEGRLLLSKEFAAKLGLPSQEGAAVGDISITATMRPIEITQVVNGEARSSVMPPSGPLAGTVPGPDVIVGDLPVLQQFGSSSGTQVGLAVATDSCNAGVVPLNWFALPNNDHPVIPQNLYRLSGGATNDERFEQIGQSNVKHAFTALQQNICGFGCQSSGTGTLLGSGCSDPYSASLNAGTNNALGSRAWINPFTGSYPRGDSATPPNSHTGHSHAGPSHRILVEIADLNTSLNAGATYYAEAQYVTPHEYAWCQSNPGQCNMYNNASHRRFNVTGTASPFSFASVGATSRSKSAISAWTGATINRIEPDPGNDGIGFVAYKVTNPSPGVWHYEYAVYNQNLDRAVQSFRVPLGAGINVSNIGFHAPPQHPAWANDGTVGSGGYSAAPWTPAQASDSLTWSSETFAQNPNANAIRWGTLYNFRFDSNRPPTSTNATIGFLKTGAPILVQIQAPTPALPSIAINDVAITEGGGTTSANFTVTLSSASTDTVTVQYATANGLATEGSDYVAASGTVTFTPSQVSQPVSITVNGDLLEEPNETFFVNLTSPVNATISDSQGVGTINNDDVLATLPPGFGETQITGNGLSSPTAIAVHPDGRVFVCEQTGELRVIKNGAVLTTPFTTLTVNSSGERGLLGIAFDPNYATNRFVYVYYTATSPIHNRVSRFTADIANEDVAVVGSEVPILDLENLSATNHNGGAIHFGPDGKLYVAVGENANPANSQSLANRLGKMLRINSDGTIPPDNPTTFPGIPGSPAGLNQAIWAVGLRNPFTFNFQPVTGRMHINDVGQSAWEEVNLGVAGANYGWGAGCEGSCGVAGMTNPIYQYANNASTCAIAGGAFYNPTTPTFPAEYIGEYFFADLCGGWIKTIDPLSPPATGTAPNFATGINQPVDIQVANDGSLYYLARGSNSVFRVQYFGGSTLAINDLTITEGNAGTSVANFTVLLSPASSQTVTVQYATANNTAISGTDYLAASGTLTFTPGQLSQPVSVTINGDTTFEPNETFDVNLSNPTNATIGDSQGIGTITNDDGQPAISIDDVSVTEGNLGTTTAAFTVSISNTSSQTVTVNYATAGNTATSGTDFQAASGPATITPGLLSTTVNVTVNSDTTFEPDETFFVNLTSPSNATISDNQGTGTISNDDAQPSISIDNVTHDESNAGTIVYDFTISLSNPSDQTITVNAATADDTATAGDSDYAGVPSTLLTFAPNTTTQHFHVLVNGDTKFEPTEQFFVNLSGQTNATLADGQAVGTVTNDDTQPTISINDVAHNEGNAGTTDYDFTVSLSNPSDQTITVNAASADDTATAGDSDYAGVPSTLLTFAPNTITQHFHVLVNGDTKFEPTEQFFVNLSGQTNATVADGQGVGTVTNDDTQPTISINDVAHNEGNAGTTDYDFTVSLSNPSDQTITVNAASADDTATTGDSDYAGVSSTLLTFAPNTTTQHIHVLVNGDTKFEPTEQFFVNLSGQTNATVADGQGVGTVTNDDTQPTISINDVAHSEGNAGTTDYDFTVSLSNASSQTITVNAATANDTATTVDSDYTGVPSTLLTFAPNATTLHFHVLANSDTKFELNEQFLVNLSGQTNATLADGQGAGTITNDDTQPTISITNVTHNEGNAGTTDYDFTVSLSNASHQAITVNAATANDTATTVDSDYTGVPSTLLTFAPNTTTQQFHVLVNGDTKFEGNEQFFVNLTSPTNATIADNQGVGTVTNDDAQPTISINDVSVTEGNAIAAAFTVSLSNASSQTITVNYATADNTATAGSDYVTASGTVTFTPGQLTRPISVTVNSDTTFEPNETFNVNLSGATNATIADNQGVGTITNNGAEPTISINDVSVTEGNAGTTTAGFTVSLSHASSQTITANYATAGGSAVADTDYVPTSGTVTFTPGQLAQPISVTVNGDTTFEPNESFNVNLSGATNATIADNQGVGTITNEDAQPTISINDLPVTEGNAGPTSAGFTVSLSNASSQTITVNYATADGTATAGSDYEAASGTVTFTPGQTSQPLSVTVNGDLLNEADVTFNVNLSAATNATIADNQGVGTIVDDDAPMLGTEENSQRAIALDAVLFVRDPFAVNNLHYFGADKRTRISLFTTNLILTPGLVVTAQAVDSQQMTHQLPVEFVGSFSSFAELTQIVVKLPDGIVSAGDLQVTITVRGKTSNIVLVGVTP